MPREYQKVKEEEDDDDEEVEDGEDVEEDREIYSSGRGDFRGYYQDGAYTACPEEWDEDPGQNDHGDGEWDEQRDGYYEPDEDDPSALHEAYFASILSRFRSLRSILHTAPPAAAVAALPKTHGYFVGAFGPRSSTFSVWSVRLRTSDPMPAQVASMDKDGVLRVVRVLLGGRFLRRGYDLNERTSRWLWALLARLPERGELNHAEIGWVRDLGRRAVLMMQSLADMARLRDALEEEGMDLGVHDAVDESSDDEDVMREMEVDEKDGEASAPDRSTGPTPKSAESDAKGLAEAEKPSDAGEVEDGEVNGDDGGQSSEPMDVSEDDEVDEGEVSEQPVPAEMLEEARARLLAQLDSASAEVPVDIAGADDEERTSGQLRARMNMRATLNMILTVAGEYYGQRDLLEFRDPFTGM